MCLEAACSLAGRVEPRGGSPRACGVHSDLVQVQRPALAPLPQGQNIDLVVHRRVVYLQSGSSQRKTA